MSLPRPNVIPAASKPRRICRAPAFQRGEPAVRLTPAPMPNRPSTLSARLMTTAKDWVRIPSHLREEIEVLDVRYVPLSTDTPVEARESRR